MNHKATVLFVTHNIAEAVYLADRVIVLSERPAQILANIPVPFERPRSSGLRNNQHFHEIINEARSFTNHNQAKQQL